MRSTMRSIEVSDEVYEGLERAAAGEGMTIENFLAETIRVSWPRFGPETLRAIDRGITDAEAGRTSSWEETTTWIKEKAGRVAPQHP